MQRSRTMLAVAVSQVVLLAGIASPLAQAQAETPDQTSVFEILRIFAAATDANLLPLAQVNAEAVVVGARTRAPKKWVTKIADSDVARETGGQVGILGLVIGGDPEAVTPTALYNRIVLAVRGGRNGRGNWQRDLGGAVACSTVPTSNNTRVTIRGKGANQMAAGTGLLFGVVRVPLAPLGISPAEFTALCALIPDLIRDLGDDFLSPGREPNGD